MTLLHTKLALSARIAAAASLPSILRRAVVQALRAEMVELSDSLSLAGDWKALGRLLRDCEIELYPHPPVAGDMERALAFSALADDAWNRGTMMRVRVERDALRSQRRRPRVIDAAYTEVAL